MDGSRAESARTIKRCIYKRFQADSYLSKLWPVTGSAHLNHNLVKRFYARFKLARIVLLATLVLTKKLMRKKMLHI